MRWLCACLIAALPACEDDSARLQEAEAAVGASASAPDPAHQAGRPDEDASSSNEAREGGRPDEDTPSTDEAGRRGGPDESAPSSSDPPGAERGRPAESGSAASPACDAPSLVVRSELDARDEDALERCEAATTGPRSLAERCGEQPQVPELDVDRLDEAVLPLDPATRAHVRRIVAAGRAKGRRANVFGLVGDSMTVSGGFMRELAAADRVHLAPEIEQRLRTEEGSVIDLYRGVEAQRVRGVWRDSFRARRAAKVGARADWALLGGKHSPVERMVDELSPAVAFVLYGGNDAAFSHGSLETLRATFRNHLEAIVDVLEREGIVPVLHTLARHGDAPGYDNCGPPGTPSDWRIAVQTNALNAEVARIACERHLPLIDLRWALDAADVSGLSPDGVHPSHYAGGTAVFDARGLRCGYNIRNYVTLRMLAELEPLL